MTGPLVTRPARTTLIVWASLAALNLAAGVVVSSEPHRLFDLETMQRWGRQWLVEGANIYLEPDSAVDYPPNGIVALSPLGLFSLDLVHPIWMMLNIVMAVLAPYLAARHFRPYDPFGVVLLPVLMFLCWGGVRTLTQFSLAALTCSMAAMYAADRARMAGGVWLGLAMMKPHVALPVFLWSVFSRRWVTAGAAVATAGALYLLFCLRAQADPVVVLTRHMSALASLHSGEAVLTGLSELRPLVARFQSTGTDAIAVSMALALLAGICAAGLPEGASPRRALYAAPPLVACWVLLTFYHLTYGFIVLLPVMMLLALNDSERSRLRLGLFWTLQMGMMFDIPGLSRLAGLEGTPLHANVLIHADRVLMLGLFVGLGVLAWREAVPPYQRRVSTGDQEIRRTKETKYHD